ncbi:class IV adenylate cyclase [Streptomyces sp. B1866]|uniref:class IV adenylate cyclase n=1 Tax=Streptomyces sp. B1866 TaxID=3075431 RepID=UPI00288CE518|nr:class IV adenylate cyclase [Streptomyces sp. B1866]MDT3395423.1 class IV adenylate cyclase [Streptomyces sp. B1866]
MIEAELKARVRAPELVMRRLEEFGAGRPEVYQDTYYDSPSGGLTGLGQELRVRVVHGADGTRSLLTFKGGEVDAASGSKSEHETIVDNPDAVNAMLRGLGYSPVIAFEKRCRNYDFTAYGRQMLGTLVRVPEIDGTFLEVETLIGEDEGGELQSALADVRAVLRDLGIEDEDLTQERYTDAVAARREGA